MNYSCKLKDHVYSPTESFPPSSTIQSTCCSFPSVWKLVINDPDFPIINPGIVLINGSRDESSFSMEKKKNIAQLGTKETKLKRE